MNNRILQLLIVLFSSVGLFAAGVLSAAHAKGITPPCGMSGSGCQRVQSDPSSVWFGIPVANFGLVGYILILLLTIAPLLVKTVPAKTAFRMSFLIATVGAVLSLGLQVYSFSVIKAQCDWCLASAISMCLVFILHALLWQKSNAMQTVEAARSKIDLGLIGVLVLGTILAIGPVSNMGATDGQLVETTKLGKGDPMSLLLEGSYIKGPPEAKITVVEFADLLCGACASSFNHLKKLQTEYPGKIRWGLRIFPLYTVQGKELSLPASVIAEHAGRKGKFWEFVEQMYQTDHEALKSVDDLYQIAGNLNIDKGELMSLMNDENAQELQRILENINLGGKIGVMETPTFILFLPGEPPRAMRQRDLMAKFEESKIKDLLK